MRILITGDLSRPDGCETNVRWLATLLEPTLKAAFLGVTIDVEYHSITPPDAWTWGDWARDYDHMEWATTDIYDLLIGWELPPAMKRGRYVDLTIHPVRYCDDVFFAIESSKPVPPWAIVPESVFEMEATLWKAHVARERLDESYEVTLVIGQSAHDRSLIHEGRFATWDDARDLWTTEHVSFQPHPYARDGGLPKGCIASQGLGVYEQLSRRNVTTVVGLSSSVLTEARYFGKRVVRVLPRRKVGEPVRVESLLHHKFWQEIENDADAWAGEVLGAPHGRLLPRPHRLRESLNMWWGYPREGGV